MYRLNCQDTRSSQALTQAIPRFNYTEKLFVSQGKLIVLLVSTIEREDFNKSIEEIKKVNNLFFTQREFAEFSNKKKKCEWFYGRILTKKSIKKLLKYSDYGEFLENKLEIMDASPNKPILNIINVKENLGLNFSISHSLDKVCAISSFKQIGVDIEKIRNFSPRLLNKFLNPKDILKLFHCVIEYRALKISVSQNEIYTIIWCIKEAVSKASGLGLKINLRKLETNIKNNKIFVRLYDKKEDETYLINILKEDKYIIAIAEKLDKK
ncbi:MAG: 4'-phosphopantetheinyl transferase family protein [Candidatus Helarchaeota archaeon]